MYRFFVLHILISLGFSSCSDKYLGFKNQYQFTSSDGRPDYGNLQYWAAHPWKWDPSDSIPAPLRDEKRDSIADVFFLYPTSFTRETEDGIVNASIDDAYLNAKTDYSSILYQASVFNKDCRIFSPRYRQAHISNFFKQDKITAAAAFDIAYADLKKAFEYYLQNWNNDRPIIIASHSQGSLLAERLLKEFFDSSSATAQNLKKKLVVAYIIGWAVPTDYFTTLQMCEDSLQTGCICSWRTYRKGYIPPLLKKDTVSSFVTNPLTWTTNKNYASNKLNKGSVLYKFNKVYKRTTDAQINNGLLFIKKPKFPWGFLYFSKNYHVGDINLFYMNIRENVSERINAFMKTTL